MTVVTDSLSVRGICRRDDRAAAAALVLAATALALASNAGLVGATLHGGFGDPDDAMRLVEVRAWLAGQSWFDMTAWRLDPPQGSFMHWSRLVDLPAAILIRLFCLLTTQATAERLAAVALPTLWLAALFAGMIRLGSLLVGRAGVWPVVLGTLFSGATLVQFAPGRIGHHAPETLALVFALGATVAALDPRRARDGVIAGGLAALALAMSLETLPFLVALTAGLVLLWVWHGDALARTLAWFGFGLLCALPPLFLVTVAPDRWGAATCDAYGAAHLGAGLIGAVGLTGLAAISHRLVSHVYRLAAALVPAAAAVAYLALAYPACLHDPFASVDPLVRDLWLRHVIESEPLVTFLRERPMTGLAVIGPVVLGAGAALAAAIRERGLAQSRFALVVILSITGVALAFWQVRGLTSVTPIALCGGVYAVATLGDRLAGGGLTLAARLAPAAILAFCSTAWLVALPDDARTPAQSASAAAKSACLAPTAFGALAALPAGSAVAPMDSGAHLLEATRLSVFAAPYHRNDDGNRFAFDVFLAAPAAAEKRLADRAVTYVLTCPGMTDMERLVAQAPDGLAAALLAGRTPRFLEPMPMAGTPYKVYAVARSNR